MKKLGYTVSFIPLALFVPMLALAVGESLDTWLNSIVVFINGVVVPFIFAIAFLVFIWGVFTTFILGATDEDKQKKGKQLMFYGIIGFVIMLSVWGIVAMINAAFGIGDPGAPQTPTAGTFLGN